MYNEFRINEFKTIQNDMDECITKGICSVNPILSSLNEIILLYLKELSFYLTRLRDFGVTNEQIKETVMYCLFNIVTGAEYNQEQFHEVIVKLYDYINQSKILYEKLCVERNIDIEVSKTYFKYSKKFDLTEAIKKGEKYFIKKSHSFTPKQKDLHDILIFLAKSMGIKLYELNQLGKEHEDAYYDLLALLDALTPVDFSEEKLKQKLEKTIEIYYDLAKTVFNTQLELYGEMTPADVSFSPIVGKAILVSGSDLKKLEKVLKATEGTEINVYTHGIEMLMAHSFPRLKSHPNLKGHFGLGMDSSLIDFASFPGAILMTKATLQKIEYLYRGRLYTTDPIAPQGVVRIKDDNYEPLIKSALSAKGFVNPFEKPSMKVGYDEKEMIKLIDNVVDKLSSGEIKHLYILGLSNIPNTAYYQYFQRFFDLIPKNCYAISLCCSIKRENIFHPDSFYDYSFLYKILKEIKTKIDFKDANISVFLTRCDKHTISNLLYLKQMGIKNVYMCKCPTNLLNPSLIKTLQETFDIKEISEPKIDLEATLNGV